MKKILSFLAAVLFAGSMFAETAVLKYVGTTTTNMGDGNNAALVNLDDSYFTVTAVKGKASQNIGLNKDGSIRLYTEKNSGDGNTLIVSMQGGKINSFTWSLKQSATYKVLAGEGEEAVEVALKDGAFAIDAAQFSIQNVTSGATTQLQLNSITIEYETDGTVLAKPVIGPDVTSFEGSLEVTITAAEGAQIYYTTDGNDPTASDALYEAPFTITTNTTVKAIAAKDDQVTKVVEKTFYIKNDTISVSQARAYIDAARPATHDAPHYVRGVVIGNVFDANKTFNGKLCIWLTDEVNSKDSLEAFQIYAGPEEQQWESLAAAKELIGDGDTILVYAPKLTYFADKKYYETDGGYFVEMLGKFVEDPTAQYDTLTVAQAVEAATALPDNGVSEKKVYVEGYAINVSDYDAIRRNQIFFMADEFTEEKDSTFEAYLATPKKEGADYPVLAGDKVRAFGFLKKYIDTKNNNKVQLEITDPVVSFLEEVEGDREIKLPTLDTITVAQAIEEGMKLDSMATSEKDYVIQGFALNPGSFSLLYRNQGWDMADNAANSLKQDFKAYNCSPLIGKDTVKVLAGDSLLLLGKLKKYWDKDAKKFIIEVERGVAQIVAPAEGDHTVDLVPVEITVAQAVKIGSQLSPGTTTPKLYIITGYTSAIETPFDTKYKNETFWMSDDPASEANTNADSAFYVYRGKPAKEKELGLHAKIRIKTDIKNFKGTIENNESNIPVEVLEEGQPFVPDTITVEEAVELAQDLAPTTGSSPCTKFVVVKGFAVKLFTDKKGNKNWYMSDDPTDDRGDLEAFAPTVDKEVVVGDYMYLSGCIVKYGSQEPYTFEISKGTAKHGVAPVIDTLEVTVAEALAIGADLEVDKKTKEFYAITGLVAVANDFSDETKQQTLILSESGEMGEDMSLLFYAQDAVIEAAAVQGDLVRICGKITKVEVESIPFVAMVNGKAKVVSGEGIENIILTEKAQKVLVDGVIYIVRDNKMFNLQGTQVR